MNIFVLVGAGAMVLVLMALVLRRLLWKAACRAGAIKIHREMSALFQGDHDIQLTSRSAFPGHEWSGYDDVRDVVSERQFRFLGAIEDITISQVYPQNRTLMEAYTDAEGTTTASTYRLRNIQVTDLATELQDGRLLLTTNAEADKLAPPPSLERQVFPTGTPVETMLTAHRERLVQIRLANPSVPPVRTRSAEDAIDATRRHMRLIMQFRKSVGFLTEAEIVAMASGPEQVATARAVWKEFQRLVGEDQARAA